MKRKLLSILLALSMALTLLPMTALAADSAVAEMDGVSYSSLAAAIEDVPANGTEKLIKITSDIDNASGITVPAGKVFTIDFDGHTYTLDGPGAGSSNTKTNAFQLLYDNKTETYSTITFKNGKINIAEKNLTGAVYGKDNNGNYYNIMRIIQGYANVTLENMDIDATNIYARSGKPADSDYILSFNKGTVNILGETNIKGFEGHIAFDSCDGDWAPSGVYDTEPVTMVNVNTTGTITGDIEVWGGKLTIENATVLGTVKESKTGIIEITGGNFTGDVSALLGSDYIQTESGKVEQLSDTNAAAQIDGQYYATLAAAYAAAPDAKDIKLLKNAENVELTGQQGTRMVTIDLNGYNLTGKITKDHDLTIKDSSEGANGTAHFAYVRCNILKLDGGNVTIDDAKILHTVQITDANVTINGGEYQFGGDHAVAIDKQDDSGRLTVNSGRFWTNHNLGSDDTEVISYPYEGTTRYTVGKKSQGSYTIKKTGSGSTLYFCDLTTAALAAKDDDTITLLADQTITEPVVVNNSVTIDGGGKNIQLDTSLKTAGIVNNYAHGVFQFKGSDKTAAVRNFKFADIEINTVLLRAYNSGSGSTLTVKDCSFKNINVMNVIRAASGTAVSCKLIVTGCTFNGCEVSGNGVILIDNGKNNQNGISEIKSNDFIGNQTEVIKKQGDTNSNAATVYLSAPATVMNNYFKGNTTKPDDDSSKNGIIVTGSNAVGSTIQENAFVSHNFTNGNGQGAIYGAKGATIVSMNYYGDNIIAHLANQGDGFNETDSSTVYLKEVGEIGVRTSLTPKSLTAGTYEYAGDRFGDLVASGYQATQGGDGKWTVSVIPSSGGGSSSGSTTTKTETTTNPDGSTTKTETKSDGSTVETTTGKDGSTTKTETKKDGSSVTESKDASGSTGTVKTDKDGKAEAETKLSSKAVEDANKNGEAVKAPVEVEAGKDSASAPTVKIDLPSSAGETKVEIPVSNVSSGTVAVIVHPDGTEEIVKTSVPTENGVILSVEGGATVKIIDNSKDFIDTRDHWSREEVNFVAARELFNGVGDNLFGVSGEMTRGMVNTVLARLAGADTTGGSIWYEKGTEWAKANGISDGTNPEASVTREQLATMLYRFAGSPAVSGELSFADADRISDYAQNAMLWAVQNGILNGIGDNLIAPQSSAERAQVAAMMARYIKNIG